VDIEGLNRTNDTAISNVVMEFGLQSSTLPGVDLPGATVGSLNLPNLTPNVFVDAAAAGADGNVFTFTTGAVAPTGDLLAFIRNVANAGTPLPNGFRIQFDNIRVDATPVSVPEPGSIVLLSLGLAAVLFGVRKR
jgi:hypothetical protein